MDESTPAPASDVAVIPPSEPRWTVDRSNNIVESQPAPAEAPTRWGLDEFGDVAEVAPSERPSSPTLTLDKLGSSADRPAPLDERGDISDELIESIAEKMRAVRPASDKAEAAKAPAALQKYGDMATITETLDLVENLYEPNGAGIITAMRAVQERDPQTLERIRNLMIASNPALAYAQSKLLLFGPEPESEPVERNYLSLDLAREIPPSLHPIARTVPEVVLREWAEAGFDGLTFQLQQYGEIQRQYGEMVSRANAELEQSFEQAKAAGVEALKERNLRDIRAHEAQLQRWKPAGEDEGSNDFMRNCVFAYALTYLYSDPQWSAISEHIMFNLTTAPTYRVCGAFDTAEDNERRAREMAEQFNMRLGQVMKPIILWFDPIFRAARSVESMAARLAELEHEDEVGPEKFDEQGRITDEFTDWVARKHGLVREPKAAKSKGVEKFDSQGGLNPEWQAKLKHTRNEQFRG